MTRHPDWEKRHNAVVAKHQALPGQMGVSDCYVIPDDNVEAVTGKRMYPGARGYKTASGAGKRLRRDGFSNVREAFAAKFAKIPAILAQRGDIGVIERDGEVCGGAFTSIGFMTRSEGGPVEYLPVTMVTTAFRVE